MKTFVVTSLLLLLFSCARSLRVASDPNQRLSVYRGSPSKAQLPSFILTSKPFVSKNEEDKDKVGKADADKYGKADADTFKPRLGLFGKRRPSPPTPRKSKRKLLYPKKG